MELSKNALQLAKEIANDVWEKYDDTYGYRSEKQERNANVSIENSENMNFFWGQFDSYNQAEFKKRVLESHSPYKDELLNWINELRMWN